MTDPLTIGSSGNLAETFISSVSVLTQYCRQYYTKNQFVIKRKLTSQPLQLPRMPKDSIKIHYPIVFYLNAFFF